MFEGNITNWYSNLFLYLSLSEKTTLFTSLNIIFYVHYHQTNKNPEKINGTDKSSSGPWGNTNRKKIFSFLWSTSVTFPFYKNSLSPRSGYYCELNFWMKMEKWFVYIFGGYILNIHILVSLRTQIVKKSG